jgi:hypothetical protein
MRAKFARAARIVAVETLESRRLLSTIAGVAFSDANNNGLLDAGDTRLGGKSIYMDVNKDGVRQGSEVNVLTNANGEFTFANINAGTYRIRRGDLPVGYTYSTPSAGFWDVTLADGQTNTGINFGAIPSGTNPNPNPPPPPPPPDPTPPPSGTGRTFYISPSGSDSAAGTSATSAWKSISRLNSQALRPGDTVLFASGQAFSGTIAIPSAEGGTKTAPINFGIYGGTARASIKSGGASAFDIAQTAGVIIANLNLVGSGMNSNTAVGIWVHTDVASKTLSTIQVNNCDVSGFGKEGMRILMSGKGSTLSDVKVTNVTFHDNLYGGLKVTGSKQSSNRNYVVDHVRAYNSPGSKAAGGVTGSGIYLADVDSARISRCVAYNNGQDGAAPVGIWAAGSNRVTIEYCESYNNHTATTTDGGGFDFDWDVSNSTIQYCYSHNNDGPGYILAAGDHLNAGNTLRYNVSENDGRRNGRAGMQLWGNVTNASIYNNVVYMAFTGNANTAAFYAHDMGSNGKRPQNVLVQNNIFYTTGGAKVLNLTSGVASNGTLKFTGNNYYTNSGTFKIVWGTTTYNTISDWQATLGQEMSGSTKTGYQGDPMLASAGQGGTIGNADSLKSLTAYKLQAGSPLVNKGIAPPTFLASATLDFYGDALPKGGKYDIGIDEVA